MSPTPCCTTAPRPSPSCRTAEPRPGGSRRLEEARGASGGGPGRRCCSPSPTEADLLVVGVRRRTGHFGLRLGRTAHIVLHHWACPFAVAPERERARVTGTGIGRWARDRAGFVPPVSRASHTIGAVRSPVHPQQPLGPPVPPAGCSKQEGDRVPAPEWRERTCSTTRSVP
ncbi:universal stress protein [Streptomyces spiralis]|uniref:universal stress protein n=1 Tax=Streptomyces spiralis TaxID=66376 RepID=UPI003F4CE7D7